MWRVKSQDRTKMPCEASKAKLTTPVIVFAW